MHRRQVCIWFDNLRRYRSGADPDSPDLTLNCTTVAVLHTTALPAYRGLPELAEIEARVPKVADDIFRPHRALFDRIDVANQGIQRVWVCAPLDIARKNVPSLNWRPFFLFELRSGTHKELLQLVVDLSCVEHRTRHCVPLLVDMKIHFALLKLCYGAAYVPWNVPQLLLGFPLVYGVWHSYKYCVELIYRAFLPFIKFLEQGNSLQVGSILARKVKVIHMERTWFVQSIRAAITNADTCPPKLWEDVYHDLGAGFPVDCSAVRYVDEVPEEQDGEAESQTETHTPKKKPKTAPAPSPSGTQYAQATPASSSGTVAPTGKGMNTFVNHFLPSQGGNTQSQNSATPNRGAAAPAKPPANTGAKKPRASGLRKR